MFASRRMPSALFRASPFRQEGGIYTVRRRTLYVISGMVCVSPERESDDGMRHQVIVATGIFLVSCLPGYAQTLVSPRIWPGRTVMRAAARFSPKASRAKLLPDKPRPNPTVLLAPILITPSSQADRRLAGLPIEERDTPFVTESSLPITAFWGGHLVLAGFESTVHMQNVQFRSPFTRSLPASSDQAALARSFSGNGIRLELHLGRIKRQPQPWRLLVRGALAN
jgi:hypothetical protein